MCRNTEKNPSHQETFCLSFRAVGSYIFVYSVVLSHHEPEISVPMLTLMLMLISILVLTQSLRKQGQPGAATM